MDGAKFILDSVNGNKLNIKSVERNDPLYVEYTGSRIPDLAKNIGKVFCATFYGTKKQFCHSIHFDE